MSPASLILLGLVAQAPAGQAPPRPFEAPPRLSTAEPAATPEHAPPPKVPRPPSDDATYFLDKSYIFNALPHGQVNLLFEAQLAPNLVFFNGAKGPDVRARGGWAVNVVLTPLTRLRMLAAESSPVPPPSFMPKLTFQLLRFMRDDGAQPPITCCELSRPRNATERPGIVAGIQVIIGHHSNGQSTCLWVPGAPDDDTCVPPPGVPLLPVPNKVNGSFSTQFYRVSALYMKTYHDAELKPERSLSGWLAWEHHPIQFLGPPGITEALHSVYGPYRIQLGGELERFLPMTDCPKAYRMRNLGEPWAGMFRARVTAELIGGIAEALPPFILTAEAAWKPYRWNGLGVFARYYYGQDYYNYNFDRTLNIVQIGIVWDTNPLPPMAL